MVSEWRSLAKENSNHSANVASFINETLPEIIDKEIETVLLCWIDDPPKSIDQEAFKILESANYDGNGNPLPGLFASFPLCKLKVLLNYHERLGHLQRVKKSYPDRLLNRFYDILSQGHDNSAPFSVGLIESLVSEKRNSLPGFLVSLKRQIISSNCTRVLLILRRFWWRSVGRFWGKLGGTLKGA